MWSALLFSLAVLRAAAAPAPEKEEAVAGEGAKARGGWMPFVQQGAATGGGFAAQGTDTAFRFFTDPNFDFQKEGQAYQASGAATGNAFGGLSQGMMPTAPAAAAPAAAEEGATARHIWMFQDGPRPEWHGDAIKPSKLRTEAPAKSQTGSGPDDEYLIVGGIAAASMGIGAGSALGIALAIITIRRRRSKESLTLPLV